MFGISIKLFWVVVAIAFGVVEAATLSLTMIWFSVGAIVALIANYLGASFAIQVALFAVVSISLLIFATKKLIGIDRQKDNTHWASVGTNVNAMYGKKGVVLKEIKPDNTGLVKVKGEDWTAISANENEVIKKGEKIKVIKVEGVKLIVEKIV